MSAHWLALDASSPRASAALATDGTLRGEISAPARESALLQLVDELFRRTGVARRHVAGIVALTGPGSFTGVRITLATALGLAPGAAIGGPRLVGLSTLAALALQAPDGSGRVVAVVDALRGEWFHQSFTRSTSDVEALTAIGDPSRASAAEVDLSAAAWTIAFPEIGVSAMHPGARVLEAAPLAAQVAVVASAGLLEGCFDEKLNPLYLRAPAVTLPKRMSG